MDRNYKERPGQKARPKSLSARRAWIEIECPCLPEYTQRVALRKESVDRNLDIEYIIEPTTRRSPQGERG